MTHGRRLTRWLRSLGKAEADIEADTGAETSGPTPSAINVSRKSNNQGQGLHGSHPSTRRPSEWPSGLNQGFGRLGVGRGARVYRSEDSIYVTKFIP
jgi:hypothetical protein